MGPYSASLKGEILISWCQCQCQRFGPPNPPVHVHTRPDSATAASERGNRIRNLCHFHVSISAVCCAVFAVIGMANHAGSHAY